MGASKSDRRKLTFGIRGPGMVKLCESRKEALRAMIGDRHRAAREAGTVADVKDLSAIIRTLNQQIEQGKGSHG